MYGEIDFHQIIFDVAPPTTVSLFCLFRVISLSNLKARIEEFFEIDQDQLFQKALKSSEFLVDF